MISTNVPAGYTINVTPDGTYSKPDLAPGTYVIYSNLIQYQQSVVIESEKETVYNFALPR